MWDVDCKFLKYQVSLLSTGFFKSEISNRKQINCIFKTIQKKKLVKSNEKNEIICDKKIIKISLPFWAAAVLTNSNLTIIMVPQNFRKKINNISKDNLNFCFLSTINLFKNFFLDNRRNFLENSLEIKFNRILEIMNNSKIKKKDLNKFEKNKCIYEIIIFKNIYHLKVLLKKWRRSYLISS